MGVTCKSLFLLGAVVSIVSFSTPNVAFSQELIGIVPFGNQRDTSSDGWLGFYLQARLQVFLAEGCRCKFYPLSTIRLWEHQAKPEIPVTVHNTILIKGSYQVVLEQGILEVSLSRFSPKSKHEKWEISFSKDDLELELNKLFQAIGKWIEPGFKHLKPFNFPLHSRAVIQQAFRFRQLLYEPASIPSIDSVLKLKALIGENSSPEFLGDLAEGMIHIAGQLPEEEKQALLRETEKLLRSAASRHIRSSRIHALLANVFFLTHKETSWIVKTANQARNLNEHDSLALLLLILSQTGEQEDTKALTTELNDINPWIWPDQAGGEPVQFEKGFYRSELLSLQTFLQ